MGDADSVINELGRWLAQRMRTEGGTYPSWLGVSVGGHIDSSHGRVIYAQDVVVDGQHWPKVDLARRLGDLVNMDVVVENDANCMAEYHRVLGEGREVSDFVVVYLAPDIHGLGSGIILRGELLRGIEGGAGELGHVVVQPEGPRCHCGNRGCLAAVVAGSNIVRDVNWGGRIEPVMDVSEAAALVANGDDRAALAIRKAGSFLGQGIAGVVNLLNPSMVIVGGPAALIGGEGGTPSSELFFEALNEKLHEFAYSSFAESIELKRSRLDLEHAAIGAAVVARQKAIGTAS